MKILFLLFAALTSSFGGQIEPSNLSRSNRSSQTQGGILRGTQALAGPPLAPTLIGEHYTKDCIDEDFIDNDYLVNVKLNFC